MKFIGRLFLGLILLGLPAKAVVTFTEGNTNNTPPEGQPFFNNIGSVNGASAVYLGDGWVMTANHVAGSLPGTVNFGGVNRATQAGSFHRLYNPTLTAQTDIVLFRLATPLGLPSVNISTVTPSVGSVVMMIGNGLIQESSRTYWNQTTVDGANNDTWAETTEGGGWNRQGYRTTGSKEIRWGVNTVAGTDTVGADHGPVISFLTQFNSGALAEEGQGVNGDSGGGVFSWNGSSWELSGMMHAVGTFDNQPGNTAVVGNATYIADLSAYRSQILTIIPEPSTAVLALVGMLLLARRRR